MLLNYYFSSACIWPFAACAGEQFYVLYITTNLKKINKKKSEMKEFDMQASTVVK